MVLPWEEAEAKRAGMDILSYQNKQMFASQGVTFRSSAPTINTTCGKVESQKTSSHSRSRSDIPSATVEKAQVFVLNTPTQPSGSFAQDVEVKEAASEEEAIALLTPPRSITPLPFKRPSFAEEMLMPPVELSVKQRSSGSANGLPTLGEISARYQLVKVKRAAEERARQERLVKQSHRNSIDSVDSMSEQESVSSSVSTSVPSTPRKSRLPGFLQQRQRSSSSASSASDDVVIYSPSKADAEILQTPQLPCPMLRVTPPSIEYPACPRPASTKNTRVKSSGFMQVMLEDGEDAGVAPSSASSSSLISRPRAFQQNPGHKQVRLDRLESSVPVITCTPATAPGVPNKSPLAALEAEVEQNKRLADKRQARAQFMISTLQRRNRAPGVAVVQG